MITLPPPEMITEVVREWVPDPNMYRGAEILPLDSTSWNNSPTVISWDIKEAVGGMTQAYELGADFKAVKLGKVKTKRMGTAYWGEFTRLTQKEFLHIRNLGPRDRERAAEELVMDAVMNLRHRLEALMEWLRWQAMTGNLSFTDYSGTTEAVDYEVPAGHKVTAPIPWDQTGSADPIKDLQDWILLYRGTGFRPWRYYMNTKTANYLSRNDRLLQMLQGSGQVGDLSPGNVGGFLLRMAGLPGEFVIYDEGYIDDNQTFQLFVPDGKVFIVGQGQDLMGRRGAFASTPNIWNGGIENASGGEFVLYEDHLGEAKAYVDIFMGIFGLPVIYLPKFVIYASVF